MLQRSIDELEIHLQREAAAGPIVWLIDDFDRSKVGFMHELLYGLRAKLADRLPVIFVLTVEERGTLEPDPTRANALQSLAGSLVVNSVGSWLPVRPLSRAEIVDWLGQTEPDIIETLLRMSEGYPPRVIETWYQWQAYDYIIHDPAADMWRKANPTDDLLYSSAWNATRKYLRDNFPNDTPEKHDQRHQTLQLCASEGETFTADCIADAIEWDHDEMQDFLDDFFVRNEDNPDGPLQEAALHSFLDKSGAQRKVYRYRFASPYTWLDLERDNDPRLHKQRARHPGSLRGWRASTNKSARKRTRAILPTSLIAASESIY